MGKMKCEEFEAMGLDAERDAGLSAMERSAAREHAGTCPRCASLHDSWLAARVELHAFADSSAGAETPARVEMRLRQEFRAKHRGIRTRRAAIAAVWGLAAAAVLVGAVSLRNSRVQPQGATASVNTAQAAQTPVAVQRTASVAEQSEEAANAESEMLVAENDLNDFTPLPGMLHVDADDASILRVRMQRSALSALGLPVNEDRAGEWIQVEMLVGSDGLPQAVRLPE